MLRLRSRVQKSTAYMLLAVVLVLTASAVFGYFDTGSGAKRYHQHTAQPSEAELGVCAEPHEDGVLCTHLPIIRIDTGGQKIPGAPIADEKGVKTGYETAQDGSTEIKVSLDTVDRASSGRYNHSDAESDGGRTMMMRIRGNSSRWFSKSSYRLRAVDPLDSANEIKIPLLGMSPGCEWALYGPFLDKTLIRNYMWMNISGMIMPGWTPEVRFCELIVDGEYRGLYLLMEMIEVQENRLNITKYRDGDIVPSYLVRIEPEISADRFIDNFSYYTLRMEPQRYLELIYPGRKSLSDRVTQYALTDFSSVERMIYAANAEEWKDEIDVNSFVRFYIIMEFAGINDTFSASTYFYRDARGKLTIGPVWDFNNALNNFFSPLPEDELMLAQRGWFGEMMRDSGFVDSVISTYRSLRRTVLSDEYLENYITGTLDYLGSAVGRNFDLWGWSFDPENLTVREYRHPEPGTDQSLYALNPDSHAEAVEWMKEYLLGRAAWMDENIETLRQYCHPSKNIG